MDGYGTSPYRDGLGEGHPGTPMSTPTKHSPNPCLCPTCADYTPLAVWWKHRGKLGRHDALCRCPYCFARHFSPAWATNKGTR